MKSLLIVGAAVLALVAGYVLAAPYYDHCQAWNGFAWAHVCYLSR